MATHDYVIANASGAAVRTDLNNALAAIVSNNSSSSEPGTTYAYQWWADTSNNVLKIRNSANNAWITLRELDGTMLIEDGSASTPGLAFADDKNTGMFSSAADKINFSTAGSERLEILSTGIDVTGEVQCDTLDVDGTSDLAGDVAVSSGDLSMHSGGRIFVGNGGNAVNPMFANVSDTNTGIAFPAADTMVLGTGGSEAIRINSNQQVLCGTTTTAGEELLVTQGQVSNANAGGILGIRRGQTASAMSDGNGLGNIFFTDSAGEKFAGIYSQVDGTPGTGDCPGRLVLATTSDGASSFTERMRINSNGGICGFGNTNTFNLTGIGFAFSGIGTGFNGLSLVKNRSDWGTCLYISRDNAVGDGVLIEFAQGGATEGTISVSGSTVSYNGGHLSRWSQTLTTDEHAGLLKGTVMTNLDEMCVWAYEAQEEVLYTDNDVLPEGKSVGDVKTPARDAGFEDNEQLNKMAVSSVEGDPNVAGVMVNIDDDGDLNVAMTGDMVIRIAQGTTVARGDLLMSAGDGTAKPQGDDIVRSKTIAKVTSTTVSATYADGSYCVPCVLMAC